MATANFTVTRFANYAEAKAHANEVFSNAPELTTFLPPLYHALGDTSYYEDPLSAVFYANKTGQNSVHVYGKRLGESHEGKPTELWFW